MPNNPADLLVRVRELTVYLASGVRAVDRVSFGIRRGECLALVGESGCGKTLSALALLRAVPPEVGSAQAVALELAGRELQGLDPAELRGVRGRVASMIFQDPSAALNPLFTVGSQIVETVRAHLPVSRREAGESALESLREAGLPDCSRIFASYPHQLSGGQRQRAMIALALCTGPLLLIADEPTTALDVTVQCRIIDLLAGLRQHRALALLLITHNLSVVERLADYICIMYAGQIVETAPARELFSSPAHPYTRALLSCLPDMDAVRREPPTIPGTVPSPGDWPSGCRFHPRCGYRAAGCEIEQELLPFSGEAERRVRCWRSERLEAEPVRDAGGK
jgi:oligopeptide/dipeptide ABC transporter ATP-binding protein